MSKVGPKHSAPTHPSKKPSGGAGMPSRALVLAVGPCVHPSGVQRSELGTGCLLWKLKHSCTDRLTRIKVKIKPGFSAPDRTFQQPHGCINDILTIYTQQLAAICSRSCKLLRRPQNISCLNHIEPYLRAKYPSFSDLQPGNLSLQYSWKQLYFSTLPLWLRFQLSLALVDMGSSNAIHLTKIHSLVRLRDRRHLLHKVWSNAAKSCEHPGRFTLSFGWAVRGAGSTEPTGTACLQLQLRGEALCIQNKNWERNSSCGCNNSFSNANSLL